MLAINLTKSVFPATSISSSTLKIPFKSFSLINSPIPCNWQQLSSLLKPTVETKQWGKSGRQNMETFEKKLLAKREFTTVFLDSRLSKTKQPRKRFPHTCYRQIRSKSTNHSPLAWHKEGLKVTLVAVIGGFRSALSITRKTDGNFANASAAVLFSKTSCESSKGQWNGRPFASQVLPNSVVFSCTQWRNQCWSDRSQTMRKNGGSMAIWI